MSAAVQYLWCSRNFDQDQKYIAMNICMYRCLGKKIYSVIHCSFQRHQDEQIFNGDVGKMEELSRECIVERGRIRDETALTGMREGSGG